MPTHEAEAVVLRQYLLSEADRIVVLLTREVGILRTVARGARKPKSRLGACLEPLNHVRLQYFMKEGGELSRVFQCETIHSYLGRNPSLDRVYGFTYFAELAQEFSQENNPNPTAFRLLLATLNAGEKLGVGTALLRYFEIWLMRLNGLLPNYDYCSGCGKCVKQIPFLVWPETGRVHCQDCAGARGLRIGPEASRFLRRMLTVSPEQIASTAFPDQAAAEVERLSERLLDLHLEKKLKSRRALQQVLKGG